MSVTRLATRYLTTPISDRGDRDFSDTQILKVGALQGQSVLVC